MPAIGRHKYDYDFDIKGDSAGARVVSLIAKNSKILELGAGPGAITKYISGTLNCDVVAVEIDETATDSLRNFARAVFPLDLNSSDWHTTIGNAEGKFDSVVAADVLEHLYHPDDVLGKMTALLSDTGAIVLSLPHVGHSAIAACLLDEDFDYRDWGLLDRTHIRFFGLKNIQALHERHGLAIEEAHFVVRTPEMTEFCHRWKRTPREVRHTLSRNRFGNVYQIVTRAVPRGRANRSIRLMEMDVTLPPKNVRRYWIEMMNSQPVPEGSDLASPIRAAGTFQAMLSLLTKATH